MNGGVKFLERSSAISQLVIRAAWSCLSYSVGDSGLLGNVTGSLPGELDLHAFDVCPLGLGVDSFNNVTVGEDPFTGTLGLVLVEFALEVRSVGINPLTSDELTVLVLANVLLTSLEHNVGALTFFVSIHPVA